MKSIEELARSVWAHFSVEARRRDIERIRSALRKVGRQDADNDAFKDEWAKEDSFDKLPRLLRLHLINMAYHGRQLAALSWQAI